MIHNIAHLVNIRHAKWQYPSSFYLHATANSLGALFFGPFINPYDAGTLSALPRSRVRYYCHLNAIIIILRINNVGGLFLCTICSKITQ